jgi:hypothetical protein
MDDKEIKIESSSIELNQYIDNSISSTSTTSSANSAIKKKNKRNKKIDIEQINLQQEQYLQQGQQLIYVPVAINPQYLNSCIPYPMYYPNNY